MAQALREGSLLHHGKYRIIKILGQGGFGITYLAEDLELNYLVAIKEYFPTSLCNREANSNTVQTTHDSNLNLVLKGKERFIKEARNLHRLNNPDIVKVYSAFEENRTAYYVMEFIEGISLFHFVQQRGRLTEHEAIRFIERIGKAVSFIHSNKFTHYDLKPQNVMVRNLDHNPILIDFGLSKQFDDKGDATSTMMYAHSDGYSPIELYNREMGMSSFSPQTDIYSLGAILYFLLTGTKPPSATQILENGLTVPEYISMSLSSVIKTAMAPFRRNRFQTVNEFLRSVSNASYKSEYIRNQENKAGKEDYQSQKPSYYHNSSDNKEEMNKIGKLLSIVIAVFIIGLIFLIIFYFKFSKSNPDYQEYDSVVVEEVIDTISDDLLDGTVYIDVDEIEASSVEPTNSN